MSDSKAAVDRLLTEVAVHRSMTDHGEDTRFADDIEAVAKALAAAEARAAAAEQRAEAAVAALRKLRDLIGDDKAVGSVSWYLRQARVLYDGTRISPSMDASHRDRIVMLLRGLDSAVLAAAAEGQGG